MTKKVLSLVLASWMAGALTLNAVPAKRGLRTITQADGTTLRVELTGDEHFHYYLSDDGLPLVDPGDGILRYAAVGAAGEPVVSSMPAENASRRSAAGRAFTEGVDAEAAISALRKRAHAGRARISPTGGDKGLLTGDFPREGIVPVAVILVEYRDVKFTHPSAARYFADMLDKEGFNEYGGTGCAREYFMRQSAGRFIPRFDVLGPVKLPQNRSYYGGNNSSGRDKAPEEMAIHAARLLESEVDFTDYDLDGDGTVDNMIIIYAGQGEATYGAASTVWPHSGRISEKHAGTMAGGVGLDRYACFNEWELDRPVGLGTFVHEFSHMLGLPDLHDTGDAGATHTPGEWSVMDAGLYNNDGRTPPNYSVFERYALGWLEPEALDGPDEAELEEIGTGNRGYIIRTEREGEFFLLENRRQTGWDSFLPGHGMLIWHIDYDADVFGGNAVNNLATHQHVDIVEAGGEANSLNSETTASYPWPGTLGKTAFTPTTVPALKSWGGRDVAPSITNIRETETGTVRFDVDGGRVEPGRVEGVVAAGRPDGTALIRWEPADKARGYAVTIRPWTPEADTDEENTDGRDVTVASCAYTATGLEGGQTYIATVTAVCGKYRGAESAPCVFEVPEKTWADMAPEPIGGSFDADGLLTARWEKVDGAAGYIISIEAETGEGDAVTTVDFGHKSTTSVSLPAGWEWNQDSRSLYLHNSIGYYGDSAPALKFDRDGATLTSAEFEAPVRKIEFWSRSASPTCENILRVEGLGADGEVRETLAEGKPASGAEGTITVIERLGGNIRRIRIVFTKIAGNTAFDDLRVTCADFKPQAIDGHTARETGDTDTYTATMSRPYAPRYYYRVAAVSATGEVSQAGRRGVVAVPDYVGTSSPELVRGSVRSDGRCIIYMGAAGTIVRLYDASGMSAGEIHTGHDGRGVAGVERPGLYIAVGDGASHKVVVR